MTAQEAVILTISHAAIDEKFAKILGHEIWLMN